MNEIKRLTTSLFLPFAMAVGLVASFAHTYADERCTGSYIRGSAFCGGGGGGGGTGEEGGDPGGMEEEGDEMDYGPCVRLIVVGTATVTDSIEIPRVDANGNVYYEIQSVTYTVPVYSSVPC